MNSSDSSASINSRRQLALLMLVMFIGFVGIAMPFPVLPPLFLHPEHGVIVPFAWGEHMRSVMLGVTLGIYPFGQFIGSPIIGALSDCYGRRRVLLISLSFTFVGYLITAIAMQCDSLVWLIASRFFTGLSEGNVALARAMAADLKDINKNRSFGAINAMASIGFVVGPLFGGVLASKEWFAWFHFSLPFYAATLLTLVTLFLSWYLLSETRLAEAKTSVSLWHEFNIFKRLQRLFQNAELKKWMLISTFFTLSVDIFYQFGPVFLALKFQMLSMMIALYLAVLSIGLAIGNLWAVYRLADLLSERIVIMIGMTGMIVMQLAIIIAPHAWLLFPLFFIFGVIITLGATMMTIAVSNIAHDDIQGEAMGTLFGFRLLGDGFICLIGGVLTAVMASFPLFISVLIAAVSLVFFVIFIKAEYTSHL